MDLSSYYTRPPLTTLSYQLTLDPAETVRASRAVEHRARRPGPTLALFGICLAPIVGAFVTKTVDRVLPPYLLVLGVVGLGALAWPLVQRYRLRRLYADTPSLRGDQRYVLTPEQFECANALAHSAMRWEGLTEIAETDEFFLFYFSKKVAYFLPKKVIGGAAEEERLRSFLRDRVGTRAVLDGGERGAAT